MFTSSIFFQFIPNKKIFFQLISIPHIVITTTSCLKYLIPIFFVDFLISLNVYNFLPHSRELSMKGRALSLTFSLIVESYFAGVELIFIKIVLLKSV